MHMPFIALVLILACATQSACAQNTRNGLPSDVEHFVKNRDICDHLAGEAPDPGQEARAKEVADGIEKYCTGTDKKLQSLKWKYAKDPEVMEKLNTYEESIESPAEP